MIQVYTDKLWGSWNTEFYSGEGSHHLDTVNRYIEAVATFFKTLESPPVVFLLN